MKTWISKNVVALLALVLSIFALIDNKRTEERNRQALNQSLTIQAHVALGDLIQLQNNVDNLLNDLQSQVFAKKLELINEATDQTQLASDRQEVEAIAADVKEILDLIESNKIHADSIIAQI